MRSVRIVLIVSAIILLNAIAFASTETPPASAESYRLAFRFMPGESVRYNISIHMTGVSKGPGGEETKVDSKIDAVVKIVCMNILQGNVFELGIATESKNVSENGMQPELVPSPSPRIVCINPNGIVVGSVLGSSSNPLDFSSPESVLLMVVLPDKPVKCGDSWPFDIPIVKDSKDSVKMSYSLAKVEDVGRGRIALLKQEITTPLKGDVTAGSEQALGRQLGKCGIVFSVDQGKIVAIAGNVKSSVSDSESNYEVNTAIEVSVL